MSENTTPAAVGSAEELGQRLLRLGSGPITLNSTGATP